MSRIEVGHRRHEVCKIHADESGAAVPNLELSNLPLQILNLLLQCLDVRIAGVDEPAGEHPERSRPGKPASKPVRGTRN
jgi:hypothetical protein